MRINRLNVFPTPGGRFGIDEGFPGPPCATGDPKSATLFMSSPEFVKFMSQRKKKHSKGSSSLEISCQINHHLSLKI